MFEAITSGSFEDIKKINTNIGAEFDKGYDEIKAKQKKRPLPKELFRFGQTFYHNS